MVTGQATEAYIAILIITGKDAAYERLYPGAAYTDRAVRPCPLSIISPIRRELIFVF